MALTFDGTNLGIGVTPTVKLDILNTNATYSLSQKIFNASAGTFSIGQSPAATFLSVDNFAMAFCTNSNGGVAGTSVPTNERMRISSAGDVGIGTSSPASKLDVAGNISDSNGNVRKVPQSGSAKTTSYTLAVGDVGEFIELGASGAIVIPDATFAAGDVVSIFNNTASTATITCSITTAYIAGTFTDKATMTLAAAGVATVLFISGTVCVVSGNVT